MHNQLQEIPAIWVYIEHIELNQIEQMLWGMEEEGIPFKAIPWDAQQAEIKDIRKEAHKAASLSPLAVGIACNDQEIVVHSRNLSPENPLFHVLLHRQSTQSELYSHLRNLGCNAARLVKGLPFKPL